MNIVTRNATQKKLCNKKVMQFSRAQSGMHQQQLDVKAISCKKQSIKAIRREKTGGDRSRHTYAYTTRGSGRSNINPTFLHMHTACARGGGRAGDGKAKPMFDLAIPRQESSCLRVTHQQVKQPCNGGMLQSIAMG